ncbi:MULTISPECIES: SUKH-4 family immunity protein [Streptomyces]|uniref:SUKH-4 family immunity protein n=1 Tax=Streptomyces lonegramiae TaxID=3075524 RepID=A0ABU2XST1_9ACTN|nr:SUKH-4 family immunity protein [Streptomyces sp. DSM 41529]MDT0548979.1 SUKH-4 family immunity protein [Streptomyces sp. DSM 41529]
MAAAVIRVPESESHPAITHEATRRWLSETGLPGDSDLMRFRPLAEGRPVPVPRLLAGSADPAELDEHIGGLLAIGHLLIEGEEAEHVLLDGATGRVFSMLLFEKDPGLLEVLPLAPSVEALTRFLDAAAELAGLRGRFAPFAVRFGARAVADASALYLSVLEEADWDGGGWGSAGDPEEWERALPALWRIVALVRPLALIAGPDGGLLLDLPEGLLEEEFGPEEIVRFDAAELPATLVHEPTRRFLAGTGLPKDGLMFHPDTDAPRLPTLAQCREDGERGEEFYGFPEDMAVAPDRLLRLGYLVEDTDVVIDADTGAIHAWFIPDAALRPLNADISTLAFTTWLLRREAAIDEEHDLTDDMYQPLADTMTAVLASVDPVACRPTGEADDWRYWPEVFHDEAGGVL